MYLKRPSVGLAGTWRRLLSSRTPPSHFSDPNTIPQVYNETSKPYSAELTGASTNGGQRESNSESRQQTQSKENSERPTREITTLLAMGVFAYFAVDNYVNRIKLEKLNNETTAINFKTLQIQQANFQNARKTRDLQILEERKSNARRTFKMALHIAHLRKQLIELGVEPVSIEQAIRDFESSVRADNSLQNVSGQVLWLDDNCPLKSHLPHTHEYDKKD